MTETVLVTGGKGQLGSCINAISNRYPTLHFIFVDKTSLDITDCIVVSNFFKNNKIDWCINCAAYTAVDRAEVEQEAAHNVNVIGAKNLAKACQEYDVKLIQISTDFVFDGFKKSPYKETDIAKPQSVYGHTKLEAEREVQKYCPNNFIVRTSWLYSEFGHNFMKTMLRLASERETLKVVKDQIGSPTYAVDLAEVLIKIISDGSRDYGVFHYANRGQISWFDFAKSIMELSGSEVTLEPIFTEDYVTLANRPQYSVLDTTKISEKFSLKISFWKDSLLEALSKVK